MILFDVPAMHLYMSVYPSLGNYFYQICIDEFRITYCRTYTQGVMRTGMRGHPKGNSPTKIVFRLIKLNQSHSCFSQSLV